MLCLKILVIFVIAQCYGHHIHLLKASEIEHNGKLFEFMEYIQKWTPFAEIKTKSGIQKRELRSGIEIPLTEVRPPAPVIELIEEKENLEAASTFLVLQRPVSNVNRVPLTRSIGPGLNTNIQGSLPPVNIFNSAQIQPNLVPQSIGEIFEGLPPRPLYPPNNTEVPPPIVQNPVIPPSPVLNSVIPPPPVQSPVISPPPVQSPVIPPPPVQNPMIPPSPVQNSVIPPPLVQNPVIPPPQVQSSVIPPRPLQTPVIPPPTVQNPVIPSPVQIPVPEEVPPARFDKTRVRQYAVYAGDVILKYLSQFFNRARLTFNRYTSPPPPTPVFQN